MCGRDRLNRLEEKHVFKDLKHYKISLAPFGGEGWVRGLPSPGNDPHPNPLPGQGEGETRVCKGGGWLLIGLLLCIVLSPQSSALSAPAYYTLSDFQLYVHNADGSKQRTELLSQLSRRQILVGIIGSDAAERDRKRLALELFLQQPTVTHPTWKDYQLGPHGNHFATYIITTADDQSLAGTAIRLNTMQELPMVDYALPILQLSQGPAAPFIEFSTVFLPMVRTQRIANFLRRQPVTILSQQDATYTLRLRTQSTTNILAVMRAFEEATHLVKTAQPIWLDIDTAQPVALATPAPTESSQTTPPVTPDTTPPMITARVKLDTGWDFPLVNVREPVTYHLQLEYGQQIRVLPESTALPALRRALTQSTGLPSELIDIKEVKRETAQRAEGRQRDQIAYILRVSKPGTYWIPSLPITYSLDQSRRQTRQLESLPQEGYLLTVNAHLPPRTDVLPGDILPAPRRSQPHESWLRPLALGTLGSGLFIFAAGLLLRPWRRPPSASSKARSPRQIRRTYQTEWQRLHDAIPLDTTRLSDDVRGWLRDYAAVLRRLLGERLCGDRTTFAGGAGISADMIIAHLPNVTPDQTRLLEPALQLLEELDARASAPTVDLSLADQQRLSTAAQQIILSLTDPEATRVFRPSRRL